MDTERLFAQQNGLVAPEEMRRPGHGHSSGDAK
jgi:hypothetical protein